MTGAPLDRLRRALDARLERGAGSVALWWRDDDLERPGPRLFDLLAALDEAGIGAGFAAIPATVTDSAVAAVATGDHRVLPHGWRHANHEPEGAKKSEFGPARPLAVRLADIAAGWERISAMAGGRGLGMFTPPWNRIGSDLLAVLDRSALKAVSGYRNDEAPPPGAALPRLDTHLDLVDWRGGRRPLPVQAVVERLVWWLSMIDRHQTLVDSPLGLLSHHRETEPADWRGWAPVWSVLANHPAARWVCPCGALCMVSARM